MSTPSLPTGASVYTQGFGSASTNSLINIIKSTRAPASTDVRGPQGNLSLGQRWLNTTLSDVWTLAALATSAGVTTATWVQDSAGTGALNQLNGDTGSALPSSGAITIAGGAGVTTSATGSTVTIALSGGGVAIDSFVPDAGTNPVVPTSLGAVTMSGTANQITTTGGTNTLTWSLPSSITAPGSLTTTTALVSGTTIAAGTTITAPGDITTTAGNLVASNSLAGGIVSCQVTNSNNANASSNAQVQIAVGGSASGDPAITWQISGVGASTMTMGLDNSAADIFTLSNSSGLGSSNLLTIAQSTGNTIVAGSLTATSGAITATNGNLVLNTAGNKIVSTSVGTTTTAGANSFGSVTLVGGSATVSTTAVTASSLIFLSRLSIGATGANPVGILAVGTITASTSFVINAVTTAVANSNVATDVSVVAWMIVN